MENPPVMGIAATAMADVANRIYTSIQKRYSPLILESAFFPFNIIQSNLIDPTNWGLMTFSGVGKYYDLHISTLFSLCLYVVFGSNAPPLRG